MNSNIQKLNKHSMEDQASQRLNKALPFLRPYSDKEDNSKMIVTSSNPAIEKLEEISNNLKNILKKD